MTRSKVILSLAVVLISFASLPAQSKKMVAKAEAKAVSMNEAISGVDETLALSDEQMASIQQLYVEGLQKMNAARKSADTKEAGKEAVKPIRKELNKRIRKEILTKEQRKALNAATKSKK